MRLERYQLAADEVLTTFEFTSDGPKGRILKLVQFTSTNQINLYNLAFGNKNLETGEIDDLAISNNGDSEKVLASVVAAIEVFTDRYPNAFVYATGSTKSRTRLYRMGISKFFENAENHFDIYGQIGPDLEKFALGKDYDAFVVKRKLRNFDL
jgi:hypothetical protein